MFLEPVYLDHFIAVNKRKLNIRTQKLTKNTMLPSLTRKQKRWTKMTPTLISHRAFFLQRTPNRIFHHFRVIKRSSIDYDPGSYGVVRCSLQEFLQNGSIH